MKTIIIQLVFSFVAIVLAAQHILGATVRPTIEPPQDWCRMSDEVTRCVGTPIPFSTPGDFCPVEVCKMSYIRAEPCPLDGAKATARCEVQKATTISWDCKGGAVLTRSTIPLGCNPATDTGCREVTVCECEQGAVERTKFVFKRAKEPTCNADVSSRRD